MIYRSMQETTVIVLLDIFLRGKAPMSIILIEVQTYNFIFAVKSLSAKYKIIFHLIV